MPVYNVEKYIKTALDSLINQTYKNWICLCMDDGSNDNTFEVLKKYARLDKRFTVFSQNNQGVTKTLNTLLNKVQGDYLYYIDSDDYIHPQTFETLLAVMQKTDADIVECGIQIVHDEKPEEHFETFDIKTLPVEDITDMNIFLTKKTQKGCWINKVNKLYKWSKIKDLRFSENLSYEDDYFYATQISRLISKKSIVPKNLYFYRVNQTSMTHQVNFEKYQFAAISRIKLTYDFFIKQNKVPEIYLEDFKTDLVNDAYRMIVRKSLKKCKNKKLRKELFYTGSKFISQYIKERIIEPERLSAMKRLSMFFYSKNLYFLSRLLVFIA